MSTTKSVAKPLIMFIAVSAIALAAVAIRNSLKSSHTEETNMCPGPNEHMLLQNVPIRYESLKIVASSFFKESYETADGKTAERDRFALDLYVPGDPSSEYIVDLHLDEQVLYRGYKITALQIGTSNLAPYTNYFACVRIEREVP